MCSFTDGIRSLMVHLLFQILSYEYAVLGTKLLTHESLGALHIQTITHAAEEIPLLSRRVEKTTKVTFNLLL